MVNWTLKDLAILRSKTNRTAEEDAQLTEAETQLIHQNCISVQVKPNRHDRTPHYWRPRAKENHHAAD